MRTGSVLQLYTADFNDSRRLRNIFMQLNSVEFTDTHFIRRLCPPAAPRFCCCCYIVINFNVSFCKSSDVFCAGGGLEAREWFILILHVCITEKFRIVGTKTQLQRSQQLQQTTTSANLTHHLPHIVLKFFASTFSSSKNTKETVPKKYIPKCLV